ncbi:MAG: PilZ domain-containing protein [Clostridia bacterium]|nr:PilZ domain-containing protein [Clostridia bacterium]
MKIHCGADVFIYHFSSKLNIKGSVIDADNNLLVIQTDEGRINNAISEGEPAVIFYREESNIAMIGCIVKEKMSRRGSFQVLCDNTVIQGQNKRMYERYPVSYYADLKVVNEQRRYVAFLKDISKYGLRIITDAQLNPGKKIEISLYLEKKILFISALIVRCAQGKKYFDYGAILTIEDFHSLREISNLIRITTEDYINRFVNTDMLNDQAGSKYDLIYDAATNQFSLNENKNIDAIIAKLGDVIRRTRY